MNNPLSTLILSFSAALKTLLLKKYDSYILNNVHQNALNFLFYRLLS